MGQIEDSFEQLVDKDCLNLIFQSLPGHRLVFSFVCRRWRSIASQPFREKSNTFGMNLQSKGIEQKMIIVNWLTEVSAYRSEFDVMKWAYKMGCPWGKETLSYIALNGTLDTLCWAKNRGCEFGDYFFLHAVKGGNLEAIKWARRKGIQWDKFNSSPFVDSECSLAGKAGNLEILKYLRENGCNWNMGVLREAIQSNHLEIIHWVVDDQKSFPPGNYSEESSALYYLGTKKDSIKTILWAKDRNYQVWGHYLTANSAKYGHIEYLRWLKLEGFEVNRLPITTNAALGGQIEVLHWAREELGTQQLGGYNNTYSAAVGGSLGVMKYFVEEERQPLDTYTLNYLLGQENKGSEILEYVKGKGCPFDHNSLREAAETGKLDFIKWLRIDKKCKWIKPISFKNVETLEWALKNGYHENKSACCRASEFGNWEILEWERNHGFDWSAKKCMKSAIKSSRYQTARWIWVNSTEEERNQMPEATKALFSDVPIHV